MNKIDHSKNKNISAQPFIPGADTARFVFPFDAIPAGTPLILYGGGIVGKSYLAELAAARRLGDIRAVADRKPQATGITAVPVIAPSAIRAHLPENGIVLIALERDDLALAVHHTLRTLGLPSESLRWFSPARETFPNFEPEIFAAGEKDLQRYMGNASPI